MLLVKLTDSKDHPIYFDLYEIQVIHWQGMFQEKSSWLIGLKNGKIFTVSESKSYVENLILKYTLNK